MSHFVYILKSDSLHKYYIGETEDMERRIQQHREGFYEHSFTKITKDWDIFIVYECKNRTVARKIENHIKNMKSKKYIENLKKYPEILDQLKDKYSD